MKPFESSVCERFGAAVGAAVCEGARSSLRSAVVYIIGKCTVLAGWAVIYAVRSVLHKRA